ncbi:hypothetical protein PHISCL_03092 [Aspergillus sclerotialis]|uniref:Uncharacterized protein n=1 Tax=Aspergillus sclerotialis TaxID=2070753 RepID=A0A3A3A5D0_9EURO|nr:hypothetical protein PHISCL_03092 [Aspergillus sclerotialis]
MDFSDFSADFSPTPRSREENQERAFIAASRRKDRSLDARVESAQRASSLHKKRTGKALRITKEIVEKEAMYEEVDERYQEKRTRMLQVQNLQIEQQFRAQLLAAFAPKATGNTQHQQPAGLAPPTPMTPRTPMGNERKMNLDLSSLPSPFSEGMISPLPTGNSYVVSPTGTYNQSSYMPSMPHDPFQNATPAPQTPTYLAQQTPTWQTQVSSPQQPVQSFWAGLHQPVHQNGFQSAGVWHRHSVQQPVAPQPSLAADADFELRPARDRLQSAPELPVLGLQNVAEPTTHTQGTAATHTRVHSQPNIPTPPQSSNSQHRGSSGASSPQAESEACDTPSTPSQEGDAVEPGWIKQENLSLSNEEPGPGLDDIDQLALGMMNDAKGQDPFVFDEFVAWDDFPTVV